MTYLSPEIEAWSKQSESKSLVRPGVSCGIFQDCNANEVIPVKKQQKESSSKKQ
ncbi:hypothetical protein BN863_34200 [Formosa agariphila KMM 3901]|uniref:Uncharacterized protein n=1 Tax=Formosa agariphila (strain DSM 15362 / KCTC 12365 / LMG 23005 / KMM 3901 / M-2Alg 35-1) TaxID=1347342 RepID=T2KQL8_FORAG|nr:hypothetical protein [Formosa agariphila]CDF81132.1 hypothetical protein BN863_34200 [Formosa agariphila KMM 3901]